MAISDFSTTGTIQKSNGQLVMASCTLQKSNGQLVMASCTLQKSNGQLVNASFLLHYQPGALAENYIMDPEDLEAIVASFRSLHVDEDDEALRQRMEQSIQEYNRKARESDHRFVRECVEAVAAAGLETEQEKLNRMAHVFFAMEDWGTNIDFDAKPHLKPKQLGDYGWPPERLDQVLELPQLSRDSLKPALSKEFSAMLVQEMT
ncbi:hypothetical protein KCU67_g9227, partial [Aureobasidium melanogenum]